MPFHEPAEFSVDLIAGVVGTATDDESRIAPHPIDVFLAVLGMDASEGHIKEPQIPPFPEHPPGAFVVPHVGRHDVASTTDQISRLPLGAVA